MSDPSEAPLDSPTVSLGGYGGSAGGWAGSPSSVQSGPAPLLQWTLPASRGPIRASSSSPGPPPYSVGPMVHTAPAGSSHPSMHPQQQQQAVQQSAGFGGFVSSSSSQTKSPDLHALLFNESTGMLSTGSSKDATPSTSNGGAGRSLAAAAAVGSLGLAQLAATRGSTQSLDMQCQSNGIKTSGSKSSSTSRGLGTVCTTSPPPRNTLLSEAQCTGSSTCSRAAPGEERAEWGSTVRAAGGLTGRGASVCSAPCGLGSLEDQMRANSPSTSSSAGSPSRSMSTKRKVGDISVSGAAGMHQSGLPSVDTCTLNTLLSLASNMHHSTL